MSSFMESSLMCCNNKTEVTTLQATDADNSQLLSNKQTAGEHQHLKQLPGLTFRISLKP